MKEKATTQKNAIQRWPFIDQYLQKKGLSQKEQKTFLTKKHKEKENKNTLTKDDAKISVYAMR